MEDLAMRYKEKLDMKRNTLQMHDRGMITGQRDLIREGHTIKTGGKSHMSRK